MYLGLEIKFNFLTLKKKLVELFKKFERLKIICTFLVQKDAIFSSSHRPSNCPLLSQIFSNNNSNSSIMSPLTILFSLLLSACLSQNLTLPDRVTIPRGGCRRVPFLYSNMPFENSLTFSDPSNSLEIIPNPLQLKQYTTTEQYQTFLFCLKNSTNSTKANNFTIQYSINGQGWDNYNKNPQKGTLLVSTPDPTTTTTTELNPVEWTNQQIKNTCAQFDIKTPGNGDGTVYYLVSRSKENRLEDCKEFESFCRNVNGNNGSVLIQKRQVKGGQMKIMLFNLLEGRNYNVCAFYRERKNSWDSAIFCREFTTDIQGSMLRGRFKFTEQMDDPRKINAFLCFITYYLEANPGEVTTIDGFSCDALGTQPQSYHYLYRAGVTTKSGNETILYIDQGCFSSEQRDTRLRQKYNSIWDKNGQMSPDFHKLLKTSNITWIQTGTNLGPKPLHQLLNPNTPLNITYTPQKTTTTHPNNSTSIILQANNLTTNDYGTVYFMLIQNASEGFRPTAQQIIDCKLPDSEPDMLCQRITFARKGKGEGEGKEGGNGGSEESYVGYKIWNIKGEIKAEVFYVEVGEYPKVPIAVGQVKEVRFQDKNIVKIEKIKSVK